MENVGIFCSHCRSANVIFKAKAAEYECLACEQRFKKARLQTIFLSYAHKNADAEEFDQSEELVRLIHDELVRDGHQVFFDRTGIRSGNDWRAKITEAILQHDYFFSFLSRRSVRDPGVCLNEINIAIGNGKRVQTFLLESEEQARPPLTVTHIQWMDMQEWSTKRNGDGWNDWFAAQMSEVRRILADGAEVRTTGELQRLRDVLEPQTFETLIARKTLGFLGRAWLFDEYQRWLASDQSKIFWIKGKPGVGKSAFAAVLAQQAKTVVIASYFCNYQTKKLPEEAAKEAILTLAYQMASRLPDYRTKLLYGQRVDQDKVQKKTADDLFRYLITEPLGESAKIPEAFRMSLVIDGLDEAGRSDGTNVLVDLISKHANDLPSWLGLVVTSRSEPYLERQLSQFTQYEVLSDTENNLEDIRVYLDSVIPREIDSDERQYIIGTVVERSEGVFLYARLLIDSAPDWRNIANVPRGLDGFYTTSFKRYFADTQVYRTSQEPFLRLMAAAPGPLAPQLAQQMLGWTAGQVRRNIVEPMGGFLEDINGGLVLFHKSLIDWLINPTRSGPYLIEPGGECELGNYLLMQQRSFDETPWKHEVRHWLPALLPYTSEWHSLPALSELAAWYANHLLFDNAAYLARQQLALKICATGEASIEAALVKSKLAYFLVRTGAYREAIGLWNAAQEVFDANQAETEYVVGVFTNLGHTWDYLGEHDKSLEYHRKALALLRQAPIRDYNLLIQCISNLGGALLEQYQLDEAGQLFREIRWIYREHDSETVIDPFVINNMAMHAEASGNNREAYELLTLSISIFERLGEQVHNDLGNTLRNLAEVCFNLGDDEGALLASKRAHELVVRAHGPVHLEVARALNDYASLLDRQERHTEAQDLLIKSVQIYQALGYEHSVNAAYAYSNLAAALAATYEPDSLSAALDLAERALVIYQREREANHPDMAAIFGTIGLIYFNKGDANTALHYTHQGTAIRERHLPSERRRYITASGNVVSCLLKLERGEEARAYRRHADAVLRNYPD